MYVKVCWFLKMGVNLTRRRRNNQIDCRQVKKIAKTIVDATQLSIVETHTGFT